MKNGVIPIQVFGVIPTNRGCAVFVGNGDKTFTIYVEPTVGQAIAMFMQDTPKERPLTHDLIGHVFRGLGVSVERIVINDLKNGTYFARLILKQENELGKKIIELDARPSDSIALAIQAKATIYVTREVFDQVEDMSEVLKKLNEMQTETGSENEGEPEPNSPSSHFDVDEPDPEDEPPESKDS
jgi:bifunctional DNase/RNase